MLCFTCEGQPLAAGLLAGEIWFDDLSSELPPQRFFFGCLGNFHIFGKYNVCVCVFVYAWMCDFADVYIWVLLFWKIFQLFCSIFVFGPRIVSLFASLGDDSPLLALHCVDGNCLKETESIAISELHFLLFSETIHSERWMLRLYRLPPVIDHCCHSSPRSQRVTSFKSVPHRATTKKY